MPEEKPTMPIPPEIAAAIVRVMGNVKMLGRQDENKYDHYKYTNIDDFLAAMGPLLAEAGLFILPEEESHEITEVAKKDREGTSSWLWVRWVFTLGHSSGAMYGPLHRTSMVPAKGAQAFGSSLSYALKQFMRGVFQIPTGDGDDPDQDRKEPLPQRQRKNGNGKAPLSASALRAEAWRAIEEADSVSALVKEMEKVPRVFCGDVLAELMSHAMGLLEGKLLIVVGDAEESTLAKAEEVARKYLTTGLVIGRIKSRRDELKASAVAT